MTDKIKTGKITEKQLVELFGSDAQKKSYEENGRFVPWHGLGTAVAEAPTSAEAIKLAGLDWIVESSPIYVENSIEIPGYKANKRDSDGKVLGIVSDKYQIVQNTDAFDFTDSLIGEGCKYETAGSLKGGKKIFLLAKLPQKMILEDEVDPYVCFTNSHDGFGAIQACMTPVRVVCNNTLNLALNKATRKWSTKHIGNIESKLEEARHTLQLATDYMNELNSVADKLAHTKVTESDGRMWHTREPAIWYMPKHKWYNVICMIRKTGVYYYCNIASPLSVTVFKLSRLISFAFVGSGA